jgi:N-acetylglucosamine-6-phosphate deacetylase
MRAEIGGARILGSHLEGSFLNPAQKGAMNPELFRQPSMAEAERLLALGAGTVRRVTLAPELPGAPELIRYLVERGVAVAGGHTDARYAETVQGIDAGVRIANHTYNAMRGLHHREPGALGAYVLDDRVLCELICDFLHVHPAAVALLLRAAGHERIAVISDAIPAAGMPAGRYQLFGRDTMIDEQGYSKLANGTLAGSTRLMLDGVRNLVEGLGVPLTEACRMASLAPARAIGWADRKGSIAIGKDADLVMIDRNWQVQWTLVEGRVVRKPGDAPPELNPAFLAARV